MNRNDASKYCRAELDKHGLTEWGIRITTDESKPFLGLCSYKDKVIILNAFHIDTHHESDVIETILHEVAHALTPGHGHDMIWELKARELGCKEAKPCSALSFSPEVIDAIRSGATIEWYTEERVIQEHKVRVTRLQDKCPDCGKVAEEIFSFEAKDNEGNTVKMITLKCFHIIKKIIPKGTPFETFVSNGWDDRVKACKHDWPTDEQVEKSEGELQPNQCLKCGEFKLLPFQLIGCKHAEAGLSIQKGFGIFDDMGLGKTPQSLAIVHFGKYKHVLYVVKSAITFQWFKQIIRWLGPAYIPQIIRTSRDMVLPGLRSYIVPYDLLRRFPTEKLKAIGIDLIVLDECQQIKNPDSARTKEVRRLVMETQAKVLPLSGTPWKNRGGEFFPVLNMLSPTKFHSYQGYLDTWVDFYWKGNQRKMGGIKNIAKFQAYVADLLIRREYEEVMPNSPKINRMYLPVNLEGLEQDTYEDAVGDFVQWYNESVLEGREASGIELLGKMARMRHLIGLAKIPAVLEFVEEFYEDTDRKLVIFVHHKDVGEMLYDELKAKYTDIDIFTLTGTMDDGQKFDCANKFNASKRAFMVASTQAGGEGVDLQTCADSMLAERQWNPQNEDQATPGRFRRIGQRSKIINITTPCVEGSIEDYLRELNDTKRFQYHAVMNKSEIPVWVESDFAKALAEKIVNAYTKKHKTPVTKSGVIAAKAGA